MKPTDLFNGAAAPSAKTLHYFATFPRMTREDWFWLVAAATAFSGIAIDARRSWERFSSQVPKPTCDSCGRQARSGFTIGDALAAKKTLQT